MLNYTHLVRNTVKEVAMTLNQAVIKRIDEICEGTGRSV